MRAFDALLKWEHALVFVSVFPAFAVSLAACSAGTESAEGLFGQVPRLQAGVSSDAGIVDDRTNQPPDMHQPDAQDPQDGSGPFDPHDSGSTMHPADAHQDNFVPHDAGPGPDEPDGQPMTDPDGSNDQCDFTGTWATYVEVQVSWPDTLAIAAGSDTLREWLLTTRTSTGPDSTLDVGAPCGIHVPDFTSSFLGGSETFGVRFPNALFDNGGIPPTNFPFTITSSKVGASFTSPPIAILIGTTMSSPTSTTWPTDRTLFTPRDDDNDMHDGVTARAATGYIPNAPLSRQFSMFPLAIPTFQQATVARADELYMAIRTVTTMSGTYDSCDSVSGSVGVLVIGGKPAIDQRILGCHQYNGSACTTDQVSFVDGNAPSWQIGANSRLTSKRVDPSTTCADVRAMTF